MANSHKRANKNVNKKLYQLEGDAATETVKGKPGRKKQQSASSTVPAIPDGETMDTLEEKKKHLQECCKEGAPDLKAIRQLMNSTFPLRRREVLMTNVRVWKLLKDYPPLENSTGSEVQYMPQILWISELIT